MVKDKKIWECLPFLGKERQSVSPPTIPLTPLQRNNLELLIQQAHELWKKGKRAEAIAAFEQAASIDPDYVRTWLQRAKERYSNLLQSACSLSAYHQTLKSAPLGLRAWSRGQSDRLSPQDRCQQAIASYDQLLKVDPTHHLAWFYRGDALLELQRYADALMSYKQAVNIEPSSAGGWALRVRKLLRLQRQPEALELCCQVALSLEQKLARTPFPQASFLRELHQSWQQLGGYLNQLERYAQAAMAYQHAISCQPDDIHSWLARAEALERLQCFDEVLFCYERVLRIQPEHPQALAARQRLQSRL
ncbi:MAG: tetratricopeptide repeat protein [Cyanobacteriota bacterium]|nr:tetratricopeptide repeat protein [Cyanobacteriota bacterium]